ncbi:hypothetical protein GGS24DRAFT_506107 [Hypoxylon argillaceum]|nr:hypothetical protein GGS24DRAFT_506107 [Hypoxylon argillaceum]
MRDRATSIGHLELQPDEIDRAMAIFDTIDYLQGIQSQKPYLSGPLHSLKTHNIERNGTRLQYPERTRLCRLAYVSGDSILPMLSRRQIISLRDTLIRDVSLLYHAHVPYILVLSKFLVVIGGMDDCSLFPSPVTYKPLLSTFDYRVDADDQTVCWGTLEQAAIKTIYSQFDVLQLLADVPSYPELTGLPFDLEPDIVVDVLREVSAPSRKCRFVIRHVQKYSAELARFVSDRAYKHLHALGARDAPPDPDDEKTLEYKETVGHVLSLAEAHMGYEELRDRHDISERAALLVVYTALLIHLYAKVVPNRSSCGIVALDYHDTADMYVDDEHFQLVADARDKVAQLKGKLEASGHILGDLTRWFVRRGPVVCWELGMGDENEVGDITIALQE